MIFGIMDELLQLAEANGCKFSSDFKEKTAEEMSKPNAPESIMWQDYVARRPMEVETYLGSPIKLARDSSIAVPRIETLYAVLHNHNIVNRNRPKGGPEAGSLMPPSSPTVTSAHPRLPSQSGHRPMMSGMPPNGGPMPPRQPRPRNSSNFSQGPGPGPGPGPGMRRGPPPMNGGPPNGYGRPPPHMNGGGGSRAPSRRGSMDGNDLEEFSHLVLYDDIPEGQEGSIAGDHSDMALRDREMHHRQREMSMRDHEMRSRRGPPPGPQRRGPHPMRHSQQVFDDDDDDYIDPMPTGPPSVDTENFDMMSVTSRKNRKAPGPSAAQFRHNPEANGPPSRGGRFRPNFGRNRSSQGPHAPVSSDTIMDDPMMNFSSNRYGTVDRGAMGAGSRANSLTASRMEDLQHFGPPSGGGAPSMNGAMPRRTSQSPGNPYSPAMSMRGGRPSPPNGFGPPMNGRRASPPDGVRQPVPRYPPGQGNSVAPQQVEQHVGVSSLHPPKQGNVRSLTGSASASAASGEAESEPSAHSSQSSFHQQAPVGFR